MLAHEIRPDVGTRNDAAVSVVVPTFNEAENVSRLIEEIFASSAPVAEVVFVDNHSSDGTREQIAAAARLRPVRVVDQAGDQPGLAGAIRLGASVAAGETIVVMDADLSHPPARIPDLLEPLFAGRADMVLGSRYVPGGTTPGWPWWRRVLSRVGAAVAYPLTGVHDAMTGFFAIKRTRLLELSSRATGFKIAFETLVRGRGTLRTAEVPIAFCDRAHGESKMSLPIAVRFFLSWFRAICLSAVRETKVASTRFGAAHSSLSNRRFAIYALVILLVTTLLHERALVFRHAIDDEAVYSLVGNAIVDGGRPYIDAVERKPPLLLWTYAAVIRFAGEYRYRTLHVVCLLWIIGTMIGLYVLGRRLQNRSTGLAAAMLYGVFTCWGSFKSLAFNGEIIMNLPIVWAFVLGLQRKSTGMAIRSFGAGALMACAFLFKQPAAIAAVPLLAYCLVRHRARLLAAVPPVAAFAAGTASVLGVAAAILAHQGVLEDAIYWTISAHAVHHIFWSRGLLISAGFVLGCLPLLLGTGAAFGSRSRAWIDQPAEFIALLAWLGCSVVGAAAGARFYPHYYLQLIPPLAVLAAPWFTRTRDETISRPFVLKYAWVGLTAIVFAVIDGVGLASIKPPPLARYIREHSSPSDHIFVWGHQPNLYLESRRRPACRYILTFPLTGQQFGGLLPGVDTTAWILPGAWSRLERDFAAHPAQLVIDVTAERNTDYRPSKFPALASMLDNNYSVVKRTEDSVVVYEKMPAATSKLPETTMRSGSDLAK